MAGWATKIAGSTLDVSSNPPKERRYFAYTRREPVGVVAGIIPWNFPLQMACWKLAPALACGCTVVLKPAEQAPLSALRLAELAHEAGFPAGTINVVTGYGETAGAALCAHPGIDKIAFTGSTEVGKIIGRQAMDNLTRVSLELGGKSPVIVLPDADLDAVPTGIAQGIFYNQGQVCAAGSRVYVHERDFERVIAGVKEIAEGLKLGPGLDPTSQLGPLVSQPQLERVCGYIESGVAGGGELITGGDRAAGEGYFVQPTILAHEANDARTVQEEIFGPVLVALPYSDIDELAALANDSPYGLAASIWSRDISRVHRLIRKLAAGTVWVNSPIKTDPNLPFGGYKQSGIGREHGSSAIELYTELKSVCIAY